jgi:hypothetical protein
MPEITEFKDKLSDYISRIEDAEAKANLESGIITSKDLYVENLSGGPIQRQQIAWRLYQHQMFYIVNVAPKTHISRHSHAEDIFRFVVSGSLVVNEIPIDEGMWFVVKANTPYEITTEHGYKTFAGYRNACLSDH